MKEAGLPTKGKKKQEEQEAEQKEEKQKKTTQEEGEGGITLRKGRSGLGGAVDR